MGDFLKSLKMIIKNPDAWLAFKIFIRGLNKILLPDQGVVVEYESKLYLVHRFCGENEWKVEILDVNDLREREDLQDGMKLILHDNEER